MSLFEDIILNNNNKDADDTNLPWNNEEKLKEDKTKHKYNLNTKTVSKYGLILLTAVILIIAAFNWFSNQNSSYVSQSDSTKEQKEIKIQVHIAGEIKNPGLYKLEPNSRIWDAIEAAGGFTDNADKDSINLAKAIDDGEQILISPKNNVNTENNTNNVSNSGKININTADLTGLQNLNGVGPSTAQKIIDYRNSNGKFKKIEDIKKVSGIGEKTFEKFKDKICV